MSGVSNSSNSSTSNNGESNNATDIVEGGPPMMEWDDDTVEEEDEDEEEATTAADFSESTATNTPSPAHSDNQNGGSGTGTDDLSLPEAARTPDDARVKRTSNSQVQAPKRTEMAQNEAVAAVAAAAAAVSSCHDLRDQAKLAELPVVRGGQQQYPVGETLPATAVDDHDQASSLKNNNIAAFYGQAAAMPSQERKGGGEDVPAAAAVLQDQEDIVLAIQPFPTLQQNPSYPPAPSLPGAYAVVNFNPSRVRQQELAPNRLEEAHPQPPQDDSTSRRNQALPISSSIPGEDIAGLAVANPCNSTNILDLPLAHQIDQDEAEAKDIMQTTKRRRIIGVLALAFLIFVGVTVTVVLLVLLQGGSSNDATTSVPLFTPTNSSNPSQAAPTTQSSKENYVWAWLPDYTLDAMKEPDSPQSLAYRFIVEDASLSNYSDWRIRQRFALATFFYATGGEDWRESTNWLNYSHHECDWWSQPSYGISLGDLRDEVFYPNPCDRGPTNPNPFGVYKHLWQWENGLQGTLPPEVFWLTSLRTISIYKNALEGRIPSTIGHLSDFLGLNIGVTLLTGGIPSEVGLMTTTKYVAATGTALANTIPSELGLLSNLRYLVLTASQLTGSLPKELGECEALEWLVLEENQLTGPLPSQLGTLHGMKYLRLFENSLSSTIPTELGNLSHLYDALVFDNDLTGSLPSELGAMPGLRKLQLHGNMLSGSIPTEFGNLSNLNYVSLQDNTLTGVVPSEVGSLAELQFLYLQENFLTGAIPSELGMLTNLEWMLLHSNRLNLNEMDIPLEVDALATNRSFWWFNVSDNAVLSGTVPDTMCALSVADLNGFLYECSGLLCGCACDCRLGRNTT